MRRISKVLSISALVVAPLLAVGIASLSTYNFSKATIHVNEDYFISFSSSNNNNVVNGNNTFKTNLDNNAYFSVSGYSSLSNGWGSIASGGYLYNTQELKGITDIIIRFKDLTGEFTIDYGYDLAHIDEYSETFTNLANQNFSFEFDGYQPNFFKITALTALNIENISIYYSCTDVHVPFDITYHLNGGSLQEAPMTENYSFTIDRLNTGTNDYNNHYTTDAFIFYNDNQIETKWAHKIGIVRHNIDNEYIVKDIVTAGNSVYQQDYNDDYFIIVHEGIKANNAALYNYLKDSVSAGDVLRVDKTLGTASQTSANVTVTFYNDDAYSVVNYHNHPITLNAPSKDEHTFLGYYDNSSFNGDPITTMTTSGHVYAKYEEDEEPEPDPEPTLRELIVQTMYEMSQYEWTPSTTFTYYTNDSSKQFIAGTKYKGLPYTMGNGRTSTLGNPLGIFKTKLDTDNYTYIGPTGYNSYYGSDCSSSVEGAWRVNGITTNATYTGSMIPGENSKIVAVGSYSYSSRTEMTKTICSTNGATTIKNAYKSLLPGDAIVRRVPSGDSWAGHVRLVTDVDVTNSTVTVIEQCGFGAGDTSNTTWKVYKTYTFATLFDLYYIPIRPSTLA